MNRRRKPNLEAQLDRELRFHIDRLTEEKIAAGVAPDEARRQAVLEFGGRAQLQEELRDIHRPRFVESIVRNLRSALRFIRKSPSFSAAVIITLALGTGANTAVFSAIDAVLLRPLAFPEGDQLMLLDQYSAHTNNPGMHVAPVRLEDWNRMNSTFQAMTGYYTQDVSESSGALPEKLTQAFAAPRFFEVWGIWPSLGRAFSREEEHYGGPPATVISDRFWRRRFGGDPNAIGKQLRIGTVSYTIVGVMPLSFHFPERDVDFWTPIPGDASITVGGTAIQLTDFRQATWYTVIGRLKPGVTLAQARADLAVVQSQLGKQYPKTDANLAVRIDPLKQVTIGDVRRSLWILFGSVTVLLLIACTNIAALLLARTAERQREIAIRYSLGASRASIVAQLLTEVFVLALAGSALALALAGAASQAFQNLSKNLPRLEEIHLDGRLVAYTVACAILTTLLCGLFPALRATRRGLSGSLADTSRTQVSGRHPLQWLLVSVQVALAVTLLVGAGLLLRTFQALGQVSPGFDPSHVLTLRISASWAETTDLPGMRQRMDRDLDALRGTPGVEAAATSLAVPGVPSGTSTEFHIFEGQADPNQKVMAITRVVSPGYFETLHIPVLVGEPCRDALVGAAVVNRRFADTYLLGRTVIGNHVQFVPPNPYLGPSEIRGIVGDAREDGLQRAPAPTVYICNSAPVPSPAFLVRTHGDPMAMAETLRRKIHEAEPARSVYEVMPLDEHLRAAFAENRLRTTLLTFFALTAVSLACVGLYGTLSYVVNVRRREVGLRLAIGALRGQIVTQFLWEGLRASVLGCIAGLLLAAAFSGVLAEMLYGVTPSDAVTFFGVALLVLLTGMLSSLLPAARAARIEPMQALREE